MDTKPAHPQHSTPKDFWNLAPESEDQPQRSEPSIREMKGILKGEGHFAFEKPQPSEQQEWTDRQLNELVMDLRVATGYPENLHRRFFDLLKPWFDQHNAELAAVWKEHDDVVDALANFSETIKQLGVANQELNKQLTAAKRLLEAKDHAYEKLEEQLDVERQKYQALSTVHAVFCAAIRKAIGMESPMPISDILDHVTALAARHREHFKELAAEHQRREQIEKEHDDAEVRNPYDELLYAVERKWPNETRHQTALRYIQEAERKANDPSQVAQTDELAKVFSNSVPTNSGANSGAEGPLAR